MQPSLGHFFTEVNQEWRKGYEVPISETGLYVSDAALYNVIVISISGGIHEYQDYEYASYNPIAYDIANHFCEMAANYHTKTPHILDYTKCPFEGDAQKISQGRSNHA